MKQIEGMEDLAQLEPTRPLFSVIISCYNSRKTIGKLLESLCQQNLNYEELEVIISDDCSTEPYDDIIQSYLNKLMIKETKTEYNCCPGNTREVGMQAATGQWICFSDHDDEFIPDALSTLKQRLNTDVEEQFYIITGFINQNLYRQSNSVKEVSASETSGWTHGKFYNLDNFVKRFDLHYKKDLMSHEDVYFTTLINCTLDYLHNIHIDAGTYLDDLYTYIWFNHPNSLSHKYDDNNIGFLEKHFIDYCKATGDLYLQCYYEGKLTWTKTKKYIIEAILLYYFYTVSFMYYNPNNYLKANLCYVSEYLTTVKKEFDITNREIWMWASDNNSFAYKQAEKYSEIGTGCFIPSLTLNGWLYYLSPEETEKIVSIFYKEKN